MEKAGVCMRRRFNLLKTREFEVLINHFFINHSLPGSSLRSNFFGETFHVLK